MFQVLFRQHDGDDGEAAFEQAARDLFTLGDEDALRLVFRRPAHRAIRREFGQVERGDFFGAEHGGKFSQPDWKSKAP